MTTYGYRYPVYKLDLKNNIETAYFTEWKNATELINFLLIANLDWEKTQVLYYPKKTPSDADKTP